MNNKPLAIIILAAGQGTRMKSNRPKVMHELAGRPMINWLLETCESFGPEKIVVVTGPDMPGLEAAIKPHTGVVQKVRDGTGGAVKCAISALKGFTGDVLILLGDTPLLTVETMQTLIQTKTENKASLSLLGCIMENSYGYGRLILNEKDELQEIVEEKDADEEQKQIRLVNTGAFCADGARLESWLEKIDNNNAQNEFYITQLPAIIAAEGGKTAVAITKDAAEIHGCNTRADLAALEKTLQSRLRTRHMNEGVSMQDPDTVYLWHDTQIAPGCTLEPNIYFGPNVSIAENVTIRAFSHIEETTIGSGVAVGPFARLRGGAKLAQDVKIGNFVEIKNAELAHGVKANHLAYLGDAAIGENTNIGAGTITCNYNGFEKNKTMIGKNVFVGSNAALVAPVTIENDAIIAAGSTVTENVPADALAIARAATEIRKGWAAKYRKIKEAAKRKKAS
ncbi:MAG: bifunctional UDP-N-acetylglucosamine diphosphorylase/glucosamine-1-phosphate N-acetyltransferase GlmU [Alphaproteobacteria bacterium]